MRPAPQGAAALGLLLAVALVPGGGASGQEGAARLAAACAGEAAVLTERCADAALAAHALLQGVGLLVAAGGALPVSPSTAGQRLDGAPRLVFDAGANLASFRTPDLAGGGDAPERRMTLGAARFTLAAGIFEGFSPWATVGGMGSLDGVASVRFVHLPGRRGFDRSAASVGAGVRLGLLRESFSLPGVTLTAQHHRVRTVRYGSLEEHGARAAVSPAVTSARLEVGKDMLALGVTAGVGWDRLSGDARAAARADGAEGEAGPEGLRVSRRYLFAGVNYTWLVSQLTFELAWSPGRTPPDPLQGSGPYRAGAGSLQTAASFRVMY